MVGLRHWTDIPAADRWPCHVIKKCSPSSNPRRGSSGSILTHAATSESGKGQQQPCRRDC